MVVQVNRYERPIPVDPMDILSYLNFGSSIASNALGIVTQLLSLAGQFL
ncbi:hypothetical protein GFY24_37050 [Nocardia sp. SYP-A9097]|nr:hypothetical protein [Nocardia sp. SYP-A9097]MRH92964.1 hypothetical protein [Nocardia sp. SYP-A9097]